MFTNSRSWQFRVDAERCEARAAELREEGREYDAQIQDNIAASYRRSERDHAEREIREMGLVAQPPRQREIVNVPGV